MEGEKQFMLIARTGVPGQLQTGQLDCRTGRIEPGTARSTGRTGSRPERSPILENRIQAARIQALAGGQIVVDGHWTNGQWTTHANQFGREPFSGRKNTEIVSFIRTNFIPECCASRGNGYRARLAAARDTPAQRAVALPRGQCFSLHRRRTTTTASTDT